MSLTISGSFGLKQFVQLTGSTWPLLDKLQLLCQYSTPQQVDFEGAYPDLKDLHVCTSCPGGMGSFGIPALEGLIQAHWPKLECLDLTGACLDRRGMQQLTCGRWPVLRRLILSNLACSHSLIRTLLPMTLDFCTRGLGPSSNTCLAITWTLTAWSGCLSGTGATCNT